MSVAIVKQSGLCETCCNLGDSAPEEQRILEINDLCYPCVRRLKGHYVTAVNAKRRDILRSVMAKSAWYQKHGIPEWMNENV